MEGWIKLHRKIIDWEWYSDPGTRILFLHLLITANFEDKKWHGVAIKRGQVLSSLSRLSKETGLSIRQARDKLKVLRMTGELTSNSTNKYTVYTIQNYNLYQTTRQANRQTNDKQTGNNIRSIRSKEDKNIRNNNIESVNQKFLEEMKLKFPNHSVIEEWDKAKDWLASTGKRYKDYQAFFRNWLRRADPVKQEVVEL